MSVWPPFGKCGAVRRAARRSIRNAPVQRRSPQSGSGQKTPRRPHRFCRDPARLPQETPRKSARDFHPAPSTGPSHRKRIYWYYHTASRPALQAEPENSSEGLARGTENKQVKNTCLLLSHPRGSLDAGLDSSTNYPRAACPDRDKKAIKPELPQRAAWRQRLTCPMVLPRSGRTKRCQRPVARLPGTGTVCAESRERAANHAISRLLGRNRVVFSTKPRLPR